MRRCDVTLIDVDVSRGDPLPAAAGAAGADNLDARAFRLWSRRVGDNPSVMAAPQVRLRLLTRRVIRIILHFICWRRPDDGARQVRYAIADKDWAAAFGPRCAAVVAHIFDDVRTVSDARRIVSASQPNARMLLAVPG